MSTSSYTGVTPLPGSVQARDPNPTILKGRRYVATVRENEDPLSPGPKFGRWGPEQVHANPSFNVLLPILLISPLLGVLSGDSVLPRSRNPFLLRFSGAAWEITLTIYTQDRLGAVDLPQQEPAGKCLVRVTSVCLPPVL